LDRRHPIEHGEEISRRYTLLTLLPTNITSLVLARQISHVFDFNIT